MIHRTNVDHIGILHFENGELNLLSISFIHALNEALDAMEQDDEISVIILTSDRKVFSAGANLKELLVVVENKNMQQHGLFDPIDPIENWQRLATVQKPVIACVKGACLGGGLELVLMCDFILASEKASFGFPEVKLGLIPGGGGTQRILNRMCLTRACEFVMLGDSISAEIACDWGLVNAVFPHDECFENTLQFASRLSAHSLNSLKAIKKLLTLSARAMCMEGLKTERDVFYERLGSPEALSNISTFLDRKKIHNQPK